MHDSYTINPCIIHTIDYLFIYTYSPALSFAAAAVRVSSRAASASGSAADAPLGAFSAMIEEEEMGGKHTHNKVLRSAKCVLLGAFCMLIEEDL
jgi:hypothetical protein